MPSPVELASIDWSSCRLTGPQVRESVRTLGEMEGLFRDRTAWQQMDLSTIVYRVQCYAPVPEGTEGGLFWGATIIEAGRVGEEYFMTHGHHHLRPNRAEYYTCVEGAGMLILMDSCRRTWVEPMAPGSLNYIPANVAHRVANTGETPLKFLACWPSDAGHDYEVIRSSGFAARLVARDGSPLLVATD